MSVLCSLCFDVKINVQKMLSQFNKYVRHRVQWFLRFLGN